MGLNRRERLVGFRYAVSGSVQAEVRRSCRNELRIVYEGGPFGPEAWAALGVLGEVQVLRASELNPALKDVYRVTAAALRLEGPLGGARLLAFYAREGRLRNRRRVEALLGRRHGRLRPG